MICAVILTSIVHEGSRRGISPAVPGAIIVLVQLFWCYKQGFFATLGGDGVFGAGGGVSLGAVAAGVLQRVPAALLLLHTQSSGQNHRQSTGCRRERLTMLGRRANTQNKRAFPHPVHRRPRNDKMVPLTLAATLPGPALARWGSSGCPCGLGGASSSFIFSTDSLLRCRVLAKDVSQELDLAQSCSSRRRSTTSNCEALVFLGQQSCGAFHTGAANLAHELLRC